ncbi:MAG: hypothetical protein HFJ79_09605 [Clostridiales bacterium]|jgi:hypothetical protein|nr:hypothetical protein [Clostridiales bacterium]
MIEIRPADPEELLLLGAHTGLSAENARGMVLWEKGERKGYTLYAFSGQAVELLSLSAPDETMGEGLLRAALNAALLAGLDRAVCRTPALAPALRRLGFQETPNCLSVELREFFNRKCRQP